MHSPKKKRKPARGVCQVCGRPVVAIESKSGSCFGSVTYTKGHTYDSNGKLIEVRCDEHWNGIPVNHRHLAARPTEEELRLAEAIKRGNQDK